MKRTIVVETAVKGLSAFGVPENVINNILKELADIERDIEAKPTVDQTIRKLAYDAGSVDMMKHLYSISTPREAEQIKWILTRKTFLPNYNSES